MKQGKLSRGLAALFLGAVVSMGGVDIAVAHEADQTTQDIYSDHFFRQYKFSANESDFELILLFGRQARKNLMNDPVDPALKGFDLIHALKGRGAVLSDARTPDGGVIPAFQKTDRKQNTKTEINFDHERKNDPRRDFPAYRIIDLSKIKQPVIHAESFVQGKPMFDYNDEQLAALNKNLNTMLTDIIANGDKAGGKPIPGATLPQP